MKGWFKSITGDEIFNPNHVVSIKAFTYNKKEGYVGFMINLIDGRQEEIRHNADLFGSLHPLPIGITEETAKF